MKRRDFLAAGCLLAGSAATTVPYSHWKPLPLDWRGQPKIANKVREACQSVPYPRQWLDPTSYLGGRVEINLRTGLLQTIVINDYLALSPGVRQPVKTLLSVRWKILDRQYDCTAYWEPAGEAEAVPAGEQTAEE